MSEVVITLTSAAEPPAGHTIEQIIRDRLLSLLELSGIGLFYAENGTLQYANKALLAMFRSTEQELRQSSEIRELVSVLIRTDAGEPASHKLHCRDGSVIHVECFGLRMMRTGREALFAVVRNMTEQTHMKQQLFYSEERYHSLLMYSPIAIVMHNEGTLVYANEAAMKLVGAASSADFLGRSIYEYMARDIEREAFKASIGEVANGAVTKAFSVLQLRRPDGALLEVEMSSTGVASDLGKPLIQTVILDITERKRTEARLRKSEKLAVLGELAAGIAHEVRNPLTSLKGFIQLLKAKSPDHAHYYAIMLEEINRINQIAGEFMLLAKPHIAHFARNNVKTLLQDIAVLLQAEASLRGVEMDLQLVDVPPIDCDGTQIKQVFVNIMKNGLEAMEKGGRLTITVDAQDDGMIAVTFADTGVGMSEERLARLGEPFYTTKEKGTGLGMMICFRIIEAHRGTIHITSKPGKGTVVRVLLPCTGASASRLCEGAKRE